MVCAFFTYMLILYAEYVVMRVILLPIAATHTLYFVVNFLIFQGLVILAIASHIKTMLSDPVSFKKNLSQCSVTIIVGDLKTKFIKCGKMCSH